jgi:pyridoxal biosynthesis lyase PdxS
MDQVYGHMKLEELRFGTELLKRGFASMQKGGVIMDVVNAEQAKIAEEAGAVAVMALERVPADIRKAGGVARMADPEKIAQIIDAVSIPVMGKVRIGHFVEAQVLEALGVDIKTGVPVDEDLSFKDFSQLLSNQSSSDIHPRARVDGMMTWIGRLG